MNPVFRSAGLDENRTLQWWPEYHMGYYPVDTTEAPYDESYFHKYEEYEDTKMGKALTHYRVNLVNVWVHDAWVLDVGIGCGSFIKERVAHTTGYDVNPAGIAWLEAQGLFTDLYEPNPGLVLTFWDSLEHIAEPEKALIGCDMFFVSLPIFDGPDTVVHSKHFRPDEHYWYFTEKGFTEWAQRLGYRILYMGNEETQLGREDILTFVCGRA